MGIQNHFRFVIEESNSGPLTNGPVMEPATITMNIQKGETMIFNTDPTAKINFFANLRFPGLWNDLFNLTAEDGKLGPIFHANVKTSAIM